MYRSSETCAMTRARPTASTGRPARSTAAPSNCRPQAASSSADSATCAGSTDPRCCATTRSAMTTCDLWRVRDALPHELLGRRVVGAARLVGAAGDLGDVGAVARDLAGLAVVAVLPVVVRGGGRALAEHQVPGARLGAVRAEAALALRERRER